MGIRNITALMRTHRGVARAPVRSLQISLPPKINIHDLPGSRVPAGLVNFPTGARQVDDHYLMHPVSKGLVKEWAKTDGETPFVGLAMETAESPHIPGLLHVVQRGGDVEHMELLSEDEIITDTDLDARQGHLELVGEPINVLTRYINLQGNSGYVMTGLNFFEQVALAAFLNRVTIEARAAAHLGAFMMVSEAQLVHANQNHRRVFESVNSLPGMPNFDSGHWTRDLYRPSQLKFTANVRINAQRVWLCGNHRGAGPLPANEAEHYNRDWHYYFGLLGEHYDFSVTRFAILPAPQVNKPLLFPLSLSSQRSQGDD